MLFFTSEYVEKPRTANSAATPPIIHFPRSMMLCVALLAVSMIISFCRRSTDSLSSNSSAAGSCAVDFGDLVILYIRAYTIDLWPTQLCLARMLPIIGGWEKYHPEREAVVRKGLGCQKA